MQIGIIGSGKIGGLLGLHLAAAGNKVLFSSRHPDQLQELAEKAGSGAQTGTVKEAASFGSILILAVPFRAVEDVAEKIEHGAEKIIIDATNPFPDRDGDVVRKQRESGLTASEFIAEYYYPHAYLVKAFNTIYYRHLEEQAFRAGGRRAIPYAGNHQPSLDSVEKLIHDIGFGPVYIGELSESRMMEPGQPLFTSDMNVEELKKVLENW